MTERTPYEEMLVILTPVFLGCAKAITDQPKMQRQWGKERRAHLRDNGWTEEEFYAVMDKERKRKFALGNRYVIPQAPESIPTPALEGPESDPTQVEAWHNLYKHVGTQVTYESRNRVHVISRWNGDDCLVSCHDASTGQEYWKHALTVLPHMRVVDGVRKARKAYYAKG